MKQKTKKQVTVILVVVFFLMTGLWYFFRDGQKEKTEENNVSVTGVLMAAQITPSLLPEQDTAVSGREKTEKEYLVVHICGAVAVPGIYKLPENSRLYEAVEAAGGFLEEADTEYHNLARAIFDGERIYILNKEEVNQLPEEQKLSGDDEAKKQTQKDEKININTADVTQLTSLPGIGEAKAEAVLEYREKAGRFTAIEEIMNVSGIGQAMFDKIKDKITTE